MSSLDCFTSNVHVLPASFTPPSLPPPTESTEVNNQAMSNHAVEENSRHSPKAPQRMSGKDGGGAPLPAKANRYHRRRFRKPYYKLSWDERSSHKGTQSPAPCNHRPSNSHAGRIRQSRRDHPLAPYNNNEFLMGEHDDLQESDLKCFTPYHSNENWALNKSPGSAPIWHGYDGTNYYGSDDDEYLSKEFSHAYEDVHAERLRGVHKSQLVTEYSLLDGRVNRLEARLLDLVEGKCQEGTDPAAAEKIRIFREEIEKLEAENQRLRTQLVDSDGTCHCYPLSRSPSATRTLSTNSSGSSSSSSDSSDDDSSSSSSSDSESDSQDQISSCSSQCSTCGRGSYPTTPNHPIHDVIEEIEEDEEDVKCTTQIMVLKSPRD